MKQLQPTLFPATTNSSTRQLLLAWCMYLFHLSTEFFDFFSCEIHLSDYFPYTRKMPKCSLDPCCIKTEHVCCSFFEYPIGMK